VVGRRLPERRRAVRPLGIPGLFCSTGFLADHHQITDEVQYLGHAHVARVTRLVRDAERPPRFDSTAEPEEVVSVSPFR
jgi:hypothetical protein